MSDTNAYRIAISLGRGPLVLGHLGREPVAVALEGSIKDALGRGAPRPNLDGSLGALQVPDAIIDQLQLQQ